MRVVLPATAHQTAQGVCFKRLPGYFMLDKERNCSKKVTTVVDGKLYCTQHGKIMAKRPAPAREP